MCFWTTVPDSRARDDNLILGKKFPGTIFAVSGYVFTPGIKYPHTQLAFYWLYQ